MAGACLNGLTVAYQHQINANGIIDFNTIQPADVVRVIPKGKLSVDWSTVIYIKNSQTSKPRGDTVIWSDNGGFYRTAETSNAIMNALVATRVVGWFDLDTMVKFLKVSGPTPFVLGPILLVSTDRTRTPGYTSWLGCQFVAHVNPTHLHNQVQVLLKNGFSIIVQDTAPRLTKKIDEARQIQQLQQAHQQAITQQHSLGPASQLVGPVAQNILAYRKFWEERLAGRMQRKLGAAVSAKDQQKLLREVFRGDYHAWPQHGDDDTTQQ